VGSQFIDEAADCRASALARGS